MDRQERIDAIKTGLAALDTAIAQTESALRAASNPDDIRSLTATLVGLRSERSRLQAQLDELEASAVDVAAPGATAAAISASLESLDAAITDRSVVKATIEFANRVHDDAKTLRMSGDDPTRPRLKPGAISGNDLAGPLAKQLGTTRKRTR
jgi:hypothetical protein